MKLKFKDGSIVDGIKSTTATKSRTDNTFAPLLNVELEKGVNFTEVNELLTEDNISHLEFINANDETVVYEGFNKSYMTESFSDEGHNFRLSFEKQEVVETSN